MVGVLEYTQKVLEDLIARLQLGDRELFEDAWIFDTRPQLEEAIAMLRGEPPIEDIQVRAYEKYMARGGEHGRDLEDWGHAQAELREEFVSEDGLFRRLLRRVGLAGKSLKMKLSYLDEAASKGSRTKLLELLNKFLGSLASALHVAEPVKELKEWLEGLLEDQPEPDHGVSGAYSQAGPDPFWLKKL